MRILLLITVFSIIIVISAIVANYQTSHPLQVIETLGPLGYLGIMIIGMVSNLDIIFPIPIVIFIPIFVSLDFYAPYVILSLALGMSLADIIGYMFGFYSQQIILDKYPNFVARIKDIRDKHGYLLMPITFCFAAFVPVSNAIIIIPLALIGMGWFKIFIPLVAGNIAGLVILSIGLDKIYAYFS